MKRRALLAGVGSIGALALVASLAIAGAGSAGTASTEATAATAESLVATITPPKVPNAAAIKKKFGGRSITFLGDGPVGKSHTRDQLLVAKFSKDTGIKVKLVPHPVDSSAAYSQLARTFSANSSAFDVVMLDVVWTGAFAPYLYNLKTILRKEATQQSKGIILNNTVRGKLVAMPWFGDFGILYYRTDLLQKYGYSIATAHVGPARHHGPEDPGRRACQPTRTSTGTCTRATPTRG